MRCLGWGETGHTQASQQGRGVGTDKQAWSDVNGLRQINEAQVSERESVRECV